MRFGGWPRTGTQRGVSNVVAVALLIALVVLLAVATMGMLTSFEERLGGPQVETAMQTETVEEGLVLTPSYIGQEVTIDVNGYTLHRPDEDDASREFFVPVAPGDRVLVRTEADGRSALLRERVDQEEAGDFVAFYPFEEPPSGGTVQDRSWNDNDGQIGTYGGASGPQWVDDPQGGTGLEFDGSDDYLKIDSLEAQESVDEFTVAVRYRIDAPSGERQQLVEHHGSGGFEWYLESETPFGGSTYSPNSKIGIDSGPGEEIVGPSVETDEVHVLVMTYDEGTMRYYQDGTLIGTKHPSYAVEMGDLYVGADAPNHNRQFLEGTIYELRLYYHELDGKQVGALSEVMNSETAER